MQMVKKKKASWNGFSLKPRREMPEGLWLSCPSCRSMLFRKTVDENLSVCPECQYHFRIDGVTRLRQLADETTTLTLLLVGRPQGAEVLTPVDAEAERIWRLNIQALGDPRIEVRPLVHS